MGRKESPREQIQEWSDGSSRRLAVCQGRGTLQFLLIGIWQLWTSDYYIFPILPFADLSFHCGYPVFATHCILDALVYESLLQKEPHPNLIDCPALRDLGLWGGCDSWVDDVLVPWGRRWMCFYVSEGYVSMFGQPERWSAEEPL